MGYRIAVVAGGLSEQERGTAAEAAERARGALEAAGHEAVAVECGPRLAPALAAGRFQAALPVLEGPLARSGDVQAVLEALGIPFVGSRAAALRRLGSLTGLAEAAGAALAREDTSFGAPALLSLPAGAVDGLGLDDLVTLSACVEARLPGGLPADVVLDEAWSLGGRLTARDASGLREAALEAARAGAACVVMEHAEGVELASCVLGDEEDALVLPAAQALRETSGGPVSGWRAPVPPSELSASLPDAEAIRSEAERCALETCVSLGVRDIACVRMLWDGGRVLVLGVDLAPSLSASGPLLASAAAAGIGLSSILDALVSDAVERG